jgi:hypothetical protein
MARAQHPQPAFALKFGPEGLRNDLIKTPQNSHKQTNAGMSNAAQI